MARLPKEWSQQLLLHFTVVILGFTGILGGLISLNGPALVWWRVGIAALSLLPIFIFTTRKPILPPRMLWATLGTGLVVGAHWVTFFQTIKLSNVSITLACLSSTTVMVAFLEPLLFRKKVGWAEPITGLVVIGGLLFILGVEPGHEVAMGLGLISAFLAGLFTILNRKLATATKRPLAVTFYEMLGAFAGLSIYLAILQPEHFSTLPQSSDLLWLFLLGSVCTALAFWITMKLLEQLSAYTLVLAINMEPVYGYLLAAWIFHENEKLTPWFYVGSLLIVGAVVGYSLWQQRVKKKINQV